MSVLDSILLLLLVNLFMFARTLRFRFANDDWEIAKCACKQPEIIEANDGRGGKFKCCKKCGIKERPIVGFWKMLRYHFLGICYWKCTLAHCMTLGVHIINTTLIYWAFGHNVVSFMAALLFAIHPVATQGSSVWLSGRNYGTAAMIVLAMKCLPILTPLFYLIAFRFALIGAPGPAQFIRTEWWFWVFLIPIYMLSMKKVVLWSTQMKYTLVSYTRKPFDWKNVILFFKTIGYYFCICIFPTHLGVHHTYLERYGLTKEETKFALRLDGFLVLGIFLCLLEFYLFFWHWGNPMVFGLTWFFIFVLPWSNICTIHQAVAERYIVLSLIGLMYALVNSLVMLPVYYIIAVYCAFVGYYVTRTQIYIKIYADVLRCAEQDTENFEDAAAAWRWRGGLERNFNLINESYISFMKAWRLRPYDFTLNANLAALLASQGNFEEAQKFKNMADKCPTDMLPVDLQEKWKERQKVFQAQLDKDKAKKEASIKQGRNELCKCGSGKKWKHCCGGK